MKRSIIMDVDTGIDDAMAIMFAATHPDIEIRAISCVTGNTSLDNVVANTCKVLDVVGAPEIPVAAGALRPLLEQPRPASHVHGADGMANLGLPASKRTISPLHAVDMMHQTLTDAAEPLTVVALAPLTNIALLLHLHPQDTEKIERIVFMGGSASVGNATAVAEFNIWHDPEAATIVMNSGIPLTMYGLDVFNVVSVDQRQVTQLAAVDNPVGKVLSGLLGFPGTSGGAYRLIGDAGAVCWLVADQLMRTEIWPVQVELAGIGRGQTIVDRRGRGGPDTVHGDTSLWPSTEVVLSADVQAVIRLFLRTLGCLDARSD